MARLVAVIPAYNEAATIRELAIATLAWVAAVIVVDDGSGDGTVEALVDLDVTVLREPVNYGKGHALRRGFRRALELNADGVVTLDGDGQHGPERIPALAAVHARAPEALVLGVRARGNHGAPRRRQYANRVADFFISWAAGCPLVDTQSGFRVYSRTLVERLTAAPGQDGFVFESEALIVAVRAGVAVRFVAVPSIYSASPRRSHFRPARDISRITRMVAARLLRERLNLRGLAQALGPGPFIEDQSSNNS